MSFPYELLTAESLQECVDECIVEIDEALTPLDHFPPSVLAAAMGVHLKALLGSMTVCHVCTKEQAIELIEKIRHDLLEDTSELVI